MRLFKLIPSALFAVASAAHAIEEPAYTVTRSHDVFEIRRYEPYIVAEVVVPGPADEAGNQGFRILAGYIFGNNKGSRTLDMTAPVTQTPAAATIPMTAPVTQAQGQGGYVVRFVMPRGSTLENLPEPVDARVELREASAKTVAVIRYSGFWSQANYEEHLAQLREALAKAGIATEGEPVLSRYDPPFTLPFLRRNEVWLTVR